MKKRQQVNYRMISTGIIFRVFSGTSTNKEDMTRSNISSELQHRQRQDLRKKCNRTVTSHKLYLPGSRLIGQKKKR